MNTETAPHILIVDDHREIRDALTRYLEKNGMRATAARDAPEMDAALRTGRFDLIVLDVMMPGEDGLSVCRRLSGEGSVPILMILSETCEKTVVDVLEMGADDCMRKPVNIREVQARAKAILRAKRR